MLSSLTTFASTIPRTSVYTLIVTMALLILTGFRLWLYWERSSDLNELSLAHRLKLFWIGFRLDAVIVSRFTLILAVALLLAPDGWLQLLTRLVFFYAGILFFLIFLAEMAGVYFFRYYDFRPNYLVLEHSSDPEVLRTIVKVYPIKWILFLAAVGTMIGLLIVGRLVTPDLGATPWVSGNYSRPWDHLGMFLLLLLAAFATRGTLDRRPMNPSAAAVTPNRVANEIASSGIFNVLYAWTQKHRDQYPELKSVVRLLPLHEATDRARKHLSAQGQPTDDSPNPLVRLVRGDGQDRPLNVVLVVMESFTSRLVGTLGGFPALTPEFDRLTQEGILLESCYATGERTIQGLEAVVSSFPPLPGVGVVRRPQARQGFATLASTLKERKYSTLFLYGGQGIFDHMRAFFLGNGFDRFIEQKDFDNIEFRTAWGVSDEDLFRRADREFRMLASQGQPFFATILTVSLHSPWEYPKGRIEALPTDTLIPPGFVYEELNNYRYADYAVGRFIREARGAPYFDDTLFVFVGDHGIHLRGRALIPVEEYRVPALFLAPKHLRPKRIRRVTSQLDLPPSIMGIIGGTYRSTFFGDDVLAHEGDDGLAIMIYNKKRYGVIFGSNLTIFSETGEELTYEHSSANPDPWRTARLTPGQHNYTQNAIALLQVAEHLVKTGRYMTVPQAKQSGKPMAAA